MGHCDVTSEQPPNEGFRGAAFKLADEFHLADDPNLRQRLGQAYVDVPFDFRDPSRPAPPLELGAAVWVHGPDAARDLPMFPTQAANAGVKTGVGTIACEVEHSGALTQCAILKENPPRLGFGQTALALVSVMMMNPWTSQGVPVDGVKIVVPLRLSIGAWPAIESPAADSESIQVKAR